ncbi:hypothetical protein [Zoogloea dura]|jgi:cytochrome oxidase Cu insertion factor (SCO1/SenC/PrrC family)|uniref:Cytochrome C oxidase subunit I n=1 Tax=Zoogloea dura TaxID=2728840 RepID=A0A848G3X3_9RHOO|nr:hypothetical protein [Zoogloea dura]NML25909.1 hypothetical protein [Zoogloea dura]
MARYRPLFLVIALLALPFIVAASLYATGWRPAAAGNHGELLDPPRPLPALAGPHGEPLDKTSLEGHWNLVVAGPGPCDEACRHWIVATRQIHVALYKQMSRVQRTWLTDQAAPDSAPLTALQPDLHAAVAGSSAARAAFDLDAGGHRVYVVDPQGRIILRYPADAPPRDILKDMERLLRYAWAG